MLLILLAATIAAVGCTNDPERPSANPSPSPATATAAEDVTAAVEIYSAVIRRLVTKDHTFGRGKSPFEHVYVVNGPIPTAGNPRGDHFGPAFEPFPSDVVAGIEEELEDLPPVTFVVDANDLRRGKQGMGGVKNEGVIISLGYIQPKKKGRIHVSNGLWCGGRCGQWLTYVLAEEGGQWEVTGTTGPSAIS